MPCLASLGSAARSSVGSDLRSLAPEERGRDVTLLSQPRLPEGPGTSLCVYAKPFQSSKANHGSELLKSVTFCLSASLVFPPLLSFSKSFSVLHVPVFLPPWAQGALLTWELLSVQL